MTYRVQGNRVARGTAVLSKTREDLELIVECEENTVHLGFEEEKRLFEASLWTIHLVKNSQSGLWWRTVNGTPIFSLVDDELPDGFLLEWHYEQAILRMLRVGNVSEPIYFNVGEDDGVRTMKSIIVTSGHWRLRAFLRIHFIFGRTDTVILSVVGTAPTGVRAGAWEGQLARYCI
ncbi:hypothetical protein BDD12DRAFT_887672 [Trichophaea hybrida]|nr:hypothetical protein BDD12DRAFT_887672 [Trichophaea hybrida]